MEAYDRDGSIVAGCLLLRDITQRNAIGIDQISRILKTLDISWRFISACTSCTVVYNHCLLLMALAFSTHALSPTNDSS